MKVAKIIKRRQNIRLSHLLCNLALFGEQVEVRFVKDWDPEGNIIKIQNLQK